MKKFLSILLVFLCVILVLEVVVLYVPKIKELRASKVVKKIPPPQHIIPSSLSWVAATTTVRFSKRDSHAVYVFDNKLWLSGGLNSDNSKVNGVPNYEKAIYYNDIWNSTDGLTWNLVKEHAEFPVVRSHSVIFYKDALYMFGGYSPSDGLAYKNGIWRSTDGITWKKVVAKPDYPEREGQKVIEFKDKLWLIGGVNYYGRKTFNDVWWSEDALHWHLATSSAAWHSRWDNDIGVLNGKLWLAGGMNFKGVGYSDEWSSEDGINWELVTPEAAWGERQGQEIVNYGGYMWLISGLHSASNEGKGDAWYTKDGYDWKKAPDDYQWLGREDHGVIVFNDKIWVIGGMDSNWHWNNDIWYSTFMSTSTPESGL